MKNILILGIAFFALNASAMQSDFQKNLSTKEKINSVVSKDQNGKPFKLGDKKKTFSLALGTEGVGGGDNCETRIQEIRDDIFSWIHNGGPQGFKNVPSSAQEYSDLMLPYLSVEKEKNGAIKPATQMECVHHLIEVQGVEKVCRFDKISDHSKITCNANSFMDKNIMPPDEQYRLIHHEYAGLAGLEVPSESQSSYVFSNQITEYLEQQTVLKLAVKNNSANTPNLEALKDGMKFALGNKNLSTYDCTAKGEGLNYGPFYYIEELEKMTSVKKTYYDLVRDPFFEYIFSYVDKNDIKYEERITTSDESVLRYISLTILKKQKVNTGSIENPKIVMDYVPTGQLSCKINISN